MGEERARSGRVARALLATTACAAIVIPAIALGGWSGPRLLSAAGGEGLAPSVATAPNGATIIAWERFDGSQPPSTCCRRVQAVIRRPSGRLGAVRTLSAPGEDAIFPRAAIGPDGTAAVIWRRFDGTDPPFTCCFLAQTRVFRPGSGWGAVQTLSAAGEDAVDIDVGVGNGGRALAMWTREEGPGHDRRLQVRFRSPRNDARPRFRNLQSLNPPGGDALAPILAMARNGRAGIIWQLDDGSDYPTVVKLKGRRGRFGALRMLSRPGDDSDYHGLAVARDGTALAGWLVDTDELQYEIEVRRRGPRGGFGRIKTLSDTAFPEELQVGLDDRGRATVAYEDEAGGERRVAVRTARRGLRFGPRRLLSPAGHEVGDTLLAVAPDGTTLLAWRRFTEPSDPQCCSLVQARVRKPGKRRFGALRTLSPDGYLAGNPDIAVGNRSRGAAAWERFIAGEERIEARFHRR